MKNKPLFLLLAWCAFLVVLRISMLQHPGILFLVWNLFLAWVPYALMRRLKLTKHKRKKWTLFICAFLFLPNAPYIVTDLVHLKQDLGAPLWFDAILFLSFALTGMIYFLVTFEAMITFLRPNLNSQKILEVTKLALLLLCGYGIYLGRFVRLNSWDLLTNPRYVTHQIIDSFQPESIRMMISVSITYGVFLYVLVLFSRALKNQLKLSLKNNVIDKSANLGS